MHTNCMYHSILKWHSLRFFQIFTSRRYSFNRLTQQFFGDCLQSIFESFKKFNSANKFSMRFRTTHFHLSTLPLIYSQANDNYGKRFFSLKNGFLDFFPLIDISLLSDAEWFWQKLWPQSEFLIYQVAIACLGNLIWNFNNKTVTLVCSFCLYSSKMKFTVLYWILGTVIWVFIFVIYCDLFINLGSSRPENANAWLS